jgi:hypothetical protein
VVDAPDDVRSRVLLAEILLRSGDVAGARLHVTEALRHAPFDKAALAMRRRLADHE